MMTKMTRELITNPVKRCRALLTGCRLGSLLGALALVPLLLCTASGAPLINTSGGVNSEDSDIYYPGQNGINNDSLIISVYSPADITTGVILTYTSKIINLESSADTQDQDIVARALSAEGSSTVYRPQLNLGTVDHYVQTITADMSNTGATATVSATGVGTSSGASSPAKGGNINIYADTLTVKAYSSNSSAYGLFAQTDTESASEYMATININAGQAFIDASAGTQGQNAFALGAFTQGVINVDGNLYVNTQNGTGGVLATNGNSVVNINTKQSGTVQLKGDIVFDVTSSNTTADSAVTVNLTNVDSWWTGNTRLDWDVALNDANSKLTGMTLNLANGATWTPTVVTESGNPEADSAGVAYAPINNLNLNNGVIDLNPDVNVKVDNLTGKGTVNMAVNADALQQTGTLTAAKATDSALDVKLTGVTSDDLTTDEAVSLVQGVSSDDGQLAVTGNVDEGLVNDGLTIHPDGTITRRENKVMKAALEQAAVSTATLDRILTNDLRKRMGDLRSANGEHGLWFRWDGGRLKGSSSLTNDFHTAQIGADTAVGETVRLGIAASFTYGDSDYARGSADMDGVALAGYGVWMAENGLYTDIVGRIGTFRTDMKVQGNEGTLDNFVASLSGEVGWRFDLSKWFYVEPQLELAYTYIEGDRFGLGSARYDIEDTDSLTGRAGLAAGFRLPGDRGNIYARASMLRQFMGDAEISGRINDMINTYKLDGEDNWFEYGIGANIRLTDAVYAWVDVERTEGALIDEEWRGTVGLRYSF